MEPIQNIPDENTLRVRSTGRANCAVWPKILMDAGNFLPLVVNVRNLLSVRAVWLICYGSARVSVAPDIYS